MTRGPHGGMGVCGAAQLAARSNRQGKAQGQREDYVTGR